MKLSEALEWVGTPVAYYPDLVKVLGGVEAAMLASWWIGRPEGEFTFADAASELGFSAEEMRAALLQLDGRDVISDRYDPITGLTYFTLNLNQVRP